MTERRYLAPLPLGGEDGTPGSKGLMARALAATAGVVGKIVTGQVPLVPSLAVVLGAVPGARLGAAASRRLSPTGLKRVLFIVVLGSALRVWWDLLGRLME